MLEGILIEQPTDACCLFVDMNSFFASVEQEVNPNLRGRPIGVCPFVSDTTVVLAASIEAKRCGVTTGTRVSEAKRLCPGILLLEARPKLYRHYHRLIMSELDNLPCRVLIRSVDEALLLVPSYLRGHCRKLGDRVKDGMFAIGSQLKCSVGVGSNMFLAKTATNLYKPDGFVEIKTSDIAGIYALLNLTDIWGISWRMARRFRAIGIYTPLDLYKASLGLLRSQFGAVGEAWYLRLRGYEVDLKPTRRRMIGHQTTIVPDPATSRSQVLSVTSQLTHRASIRLRRSNLAAKSVILTLRTQDRAWWGATYRGDKPFFDSSEFLSHVRRLLEGFRMESPVRFISVSATDLLPRPYLNLSLLQDYEPQLQINRAIDRINFRYGENTIGSATRLLSGHTRDAIGFGNAASNARELPK